MTNDNAYNDAYDYETFIRRAFKNVTSEGKNGEHGIQMTNLIDIEEGKDLSKLASSNIKQLEKVKGFIAKAISKFLKMSLDKKEKFEFLSMKSDLEKAKSSKDLIAIVARGLVITDRF
ncbi:hypothetical protein [Dyadobacter sp. CY356]|uniref:hypothetical protein n=1 Tax=Dyadobacter sp. CY356 TaxID=2906442 RepID=UPI001F437507|nr:hypothetical protein [Dyadobacter sp. CY356]MCF0058773.1 hypothetical protein [Dyadobacter sp. CY356]